MAPIILKDYVFNENDGFLTIRVPFKKSLANQPDIFTFRNYLKVSARPYLFEMFLFADIDEELSRCQLTDDEIIFELKKAEPGTWGQIAADLDRNAKIIKRKEIAEGKHKKLAEEKAAKEEQLRSLQQISVQEQIDLDSRNRVAVEEIKKNEKEQAMSEFEEWKKKKEKAETQSVRSSSHCNVSAGNCEFPIPLVRSTGSIQVKFSERVFPTPQRESLHNEEQEYLAKQLEARRATGFVSDDLRPEECNPTWLKNKGDKFHEEKNYLGAISAYSHAIKIGSKLPGIFLNRSASHFALGNLHKALEDCSTAIELLVPKVQSNADARAAAHARRAVILCQLGVPEKSLPEFEEALRLQPEDALLRDDYENAKRLMEDDEESDD